MYSAKESTKVSTQGAQKLRKGHEVAMQASEEASDVPPVTDSYPKHRKRINRKKKRGVTKINYINMHGGRSREKWLEVRGQLEKEKKN